MSESSLTVDPNHRMEQIWEERVQKRVQQQRKKPVNRARQLSHEEQMWENQTLKEVIELYTK
jgi:hypothetical protein